MKDGHQEDITTAEDAINNVREPKLKNFAGKSLPVLKEHLDIITKIKSVQH